MIADDPQARRIEMLEQELARERLARTEAEAVAERGRRALASHDELTGFYNRGHLQRLLRAAIRRAREAAGRRSAVLFLDVDRFGSIDQGLGHLAGNEVIMEISVRLQQVVDDWLRVHDTVIHIARTGRDEFLLLLEGIEDSDAAADFTDAAYAALLPPMPAGGQNIKLAISGGLVETERGVSAADLIRNAELTTRRAKSMGGAHWLRFDDDMHRRAMERLNLESDLSVAIENSQLRLSYQPIYELDTRQIMGFEALLRWQRTPQQEEAPNIFIGVAEETGHIVPIGAWVIREACSALAKLQLAFPCDPPLFMSINVSARQFRDAALASQFREAIIESRIPADSVHLEVTESITIDDLGQTASTLQSLQVVGVRCGIDDFGTGYSSLNYLHELPFDTLKVDRSFVARLGQPGKSREIVRTVIGLAKHLRMGVIAEGIETEFHLTSLIEMGCEMGQGYLLARPLKLEKALEILAQPGLLLQRERQQIPK